MSERAVLLQLVEAADGVEPNWEDALRRAGFLGRRLPQRHRPLRRRRVLVLVAAVLAVIYVVSAVASDRPPVGLVYRLVDRSDEKYPVEQAPTLEGWVRRPRAINEAVMTPKGSMRLVTEVPTMHGSIAGHRFEMSALFRYHRSVRVRLLQVHFSPGGPAENAYGTKVPSIGGGSSAQIRGVDEPLEEEAVHWVSITADYAGEAPITKDGVGRGPKWLYGAANPKVTRVDLENTNDGTVVSVPTFAAPEGFPVRARFWVAALRLDRLVHVVVPRDKDGDELERWEMMMAL
jgi:hypothetical protein